VPHFFQRTFRLNLYVTVLDDFRLALEILLVIFVVYYIFAYIREVMQLHINIYSHLTLQLVKEIRTFRKFPSNFLSDVWNIVEFINLAVYDMRAALY
jgi:hypothetical protein